MSDKQSFEEWYATSYHFDTRGASQATWNHQQAIIDEKETTIRDLEAAYCHMASLHSDRCMELDEKDKKMMDLERLTADLRWMRE